MYEAGREATREECRIHTSQWKSYGQKMPLAMVLLNINATGYSYIRSMIRSLGHKPNPGQPATAYGVNQRQQSRRNLDWLRLGPSEISTMVFFRAFIYLDEERRLHHRQTVFHTPGADG